MILSGGSHVVGSRGAELGFGTSAPRRTVQVVVEVACDESGSEGENLVGGETDVFAHASVEASVEGANECIRELRARIRSPAEEYKANHLLREKHRPALVWLLGPSGPLAGRAHVHLIDKTFFLVRKLVELLGEERGALAVAVHREGPETCGPDRWDAFLRSFNALLRAREPQDVEMTTAACFRRVDLLRSGGVSGSRVDGVLERLQRARPEAGTFRARVGPELNPLLPALVETVRRWGAAGRPVAVVHDRQDALTPERLAWLREVLDGRLATVRLVDSRFDPRVQVADFLAGVARKIASEELRGRGDAELTALLRPYVGASSIWPTTPRWF